MKRLSAILLVSILFIASTSFAAVKTYQVTGPVISIDNTKIVVKKGNDNWEITRTPDLKLGDNVKVGSKVTIQYTMNATEVEAKATDTDGTTTKKTKTAKTAK